MNQNFLRRILLVGLATLCLANTAAAAKATAKASPKPAPPNAAAAMFVLSEQLISYADQHQDPLAYLVAATIQRDIGINDAKGAPNFVSLLGQAKKVVENRSDIVALAQNIADGTSRSVAGAGSQTFPLVLPSMQPQRLNVTMQGDAEAVAIVLPNNDGRAPQALNVQMTIYHANGSQVPASCQPLDHFGAVRCAWNPRTTASYFVELKNNSGQSAPVVMRLF